MRSTRAVITVLISILAGSCRTVPPPVEPSASLSITPPPVSPALAPSPTATPEEFVLPLELAEPLELEILVHSDKSGNNQIYLLDCSSGEMKPLTEGLASNCFASWSPDREKIVFTSDRDGNSEIYLMDDDGDDPERITDHPGPDTFPAWSPDNRSIVFFSGRNGAENLHRYDLEDGSIRPLTNFPEGQGGVIAFSPDGSKIFFGFDRIGRYKIYQLEACGGEPKEIITNALRNSRMTCLEDPDGLALLYVSGTAGQDDIWLSYVADGRFVNITRDPAPDHSPTISPDGGSVIFTSLRNGGNWQLYLVSRSGRPVENKVIRITDDGFNYWFPHVR